MPQPMRDDGIRKRCEKLLSDLPVPGFIVFGWEKPGKEYDVVYSVKNVPMKVLLRILVSLLHDMVMKMK